MSYLNGCYMNLSLNTSRFDKLAIIISVYSDIPSDYTIPCALYCTVGELAPAILATVNISGNLVDFYIVHFGNEE